MSEFLKQFSVSGIESPVNVSENINSRANSGDNCAVPTADYCNPPPDTNADGC